MENFSTQSNEQSCAKYGKTMRDNVFCFDKNYHLTNSGSFGSIPREIMQKRFDLQMELEKVPEINYRFKCFDVFDDTVSPN